MKFQKIVADTQEARLALQDVESRHKELIKIENALTEVRNLFVQMARLVSQQVNYINIL